MTIFIVITLFSVTGILRSRDTQVAKDAAEHIKSEIRKAQVKAISTEGVCDPAEGTVPKLWGLRVTNTAEVETYFWCPNDPIPAPPAAVPASHPGQWFFRERLEFNIAPNTVAISSGSTVCYVFNAPYGRFYQVSDCTGSESMLNDVVPERSVRPSGSFTTDTTITSTYNGQAFRTVVNGTRGSVEVN